MNVSHSWQDAPLVFITAPHCPRCLAPRPIIIRSEQGGDGSVSRRCVCRSCSSRFVLVVEMPGDGLPKIGRGEYDVL